MMLDETSPGGNESGSVPVWFVTFGDMMSLLLTFFVMLVSCSEMKSEEKYQALMDAFQHQFGHRDLAKEVLPGELRPRNSALSKIAAEGIFRRRQKLRSTAQVPLLMEVSDFSQSSARPSQTAVGTVLYFQQEQIEMDPNQQSAPRPLPLAPQPTSNPN